MGAERTQLSVQHSQKEVANTEEQKEVKWGWDHSESSTIEVLMETAVPFERGGENSFLDKDVDTR